MLGQVISFNLNANFSGERWVGLVTATRPDYLTVRRLYPNGCIGTTYDIDRDNQTIRTQADIQHIDTTLRGES